jgi:hypothetical protein
MRNAHIPFLLVASKCDFDPTHRRVDPAGVSKALFGDPVTTFQTSEAAPDTQKRCVGVLLRAIVAQRTRMLCFPPPFPEPLLLFNLVSRLGGRSPIKTVRFERQAGELQNRQLCRDRTIGTIGTIGSPVSFLFLTSDECRAIESQCKPKTGQFTRPATCAVYQSAIAETQSRKFRGDNAHVSDSRARPVSTRVESSPKRKIKVKVASAATHEWLAPGHF